MRSASAILVLLAHLLCSGYAQSGMDPSEDPSMDEVEVRDSAYLRSADALVAQLAEQLALLPPELRAPFLRCMNEEMNVGRVGECLRMARRAATTPSASASSVVSTDEGRTTASETTSEATTTTEKPTTRPINNIDVAKAKFKQRLAELRAKMRSSGARTARFESLKATIGNKPEQPILANDEVVDQEEDGPIVATRKPKLDLKKNELKKTAAKLEQQADESEGSAELATTTTESVITTTELPQKHHARFRVRSAASLHELPSVGKPTPSPVSSMSQLILSFLRPNATGAEEEKLLEDHERFAEEEKIFSGPRPVSPVQFFDVELGKTNGKQPALKGADLPLTQETYSLIKGLSSTGSKDPRKDEQIKKQKDETFRREDQPITLLSPKIGALLPTKEKAVGLLSPSLFAMYEDSREQQILAIPTVLKDLGLKEQDRKKVMEVALELAGARKVMKKAEADHREFRL